MASESESGTIREQRQGSMGSDERALEERRKIQKLIRADDELVIPQLFEKLDSYLAQPSNAAIPAAEMAAVGLGKLSSIGSTQRYKAQSLLGADATIEDLLVHALINGKNARDLRRSLKKRDKKKPLQDNTPAVAPHLGVDALLRRRLVGRGERGGGP